MVQIIGVGGAQQGRRVGHRDAGVARVDVLEQEDERAVGGVADGDGFEDRWRWGGLIKRIKN